MIWVRVQRGGHTIYEGFAPESRDGGVRLPAFVEWRIRCEVGADVEWDLRHA